MFILSVLEDDFRVHPKDLSKTPLDAVTEVIERRFVDKVIAELGLVVSIYDVQHIEGGFIYANDGAAYFKVRFRVVVFRPFVGEVVIGNLTASTRDGLKLSLGFFEDITIPEYSLQDPSFFDDREKLWKWHYEGQDMWMDLKESVRFKVRSVKFYPEPTPQQLQNAAGDDKLLGTAARPFAPMEVIGDINGDGLGLISWWSGTADE